MAATPSVSNYRPDLLRAHRPPEGGGGATARRASPFPVQWLVIAIALTISMFFWLGWHVQDSFKVNRALKDELVSAEELRDAIAHYHERLCMAAHMAVATGEPRWGREYGELETRLDAAVSRALADESLKDKALLAEARAAQTRLAELHQTAMALAGSDQRPEALALLSSRELEGRQRAVGDATDRFIQQIRTDIDARLELAWREELFSLGVSFVIFAISGAVWLALIGRLRRWRSELLHEAAARVQAEEELRQAQKLEAVGQLAGGIAHDLNNLLTAVSGYASLVKTTLPGEHPALGSLERLEQVAEQAYGVTRALLTFSRKSATQKQPTDLAALVDKTARLLRCMLPASIEFVVDKPSAVHVWVNADEVQLQQVLMNLAINARDAMPQGGTLRLALALPRHDDRDPAARLSVTDTGIGMPPEMHARIFEPFFTTKPRGHGTGLGLPMVHGIVSDHGGEITVESALGQGSTFTVILPIIGQSEVAKPTGVSEPHVTGHGEHVVIAEDHPYVREIMSSTLQSAGFSVEQVGDGPSLLRHVRGHRQEVQLLIVDLDLPGRDGLSCIRELRAEGVTAPAIMVTGMLEATLEDSLQGMALLLRKPFQMAELSRLAVRLTTGVQDESGLP